MTSDAFANVDPYHPGMVVALEPERCKDSSEISLRKTTQWARDWTSFSWMYVLLNQDSLGELAYRSLLIEARQNRLPGSQMYSMVRDRNMLKASMRAGVKGVVIEPIVSSWAHTRGYFQRVDAAQEDIIRRDDRYNLKKVPVLAYHTDGEGDLEALLHLKEEGLIAGCADATKEGTLLEVYDKREHPNFTLLRSAPRAQSWLAWNHGAFPIVRMPDIGTAFKYIVVGDLWHRYTSVNIERKVPAIV